MNLTKLLTNINYWFSFASAGIASLKARLVWSSVFLHSLMLGIMLTTSFLSMWISNTATTAMMVPIVEAVLGEIKHENIGNQFEKKNNENSLGDEVGRLTLSVVFRWLRHERSGKRFSHTHLRVWVLVCGGYRSHGSRDCSLFLLPFTLLVFWSFFPAS